MAYELNEMGKFLVAEAQERNRLIPKNIYANRPIITLRQSDTFVIQKHKEFCEISRRSIEAGFIIRCRKCKQPQKMPLNKKCNHCTPKQAGHNLQKAYRYHVATSARWFQPHHTTFAAFVNAPFQNPPELHPEHKAYRLARHNDPKLTMMKFLDVEPPPAPENPPENYIIDDNGFSFPQWQVYQAHTGQVPEKELLHHVRSMSHAHEILDQHAPPGSNWIGLTSFAQYCQEATS